MKSLRSKPVGFGDVADDICRAECIMVPCPQVRTCHSGQTQGLQRNTSIMDIGDLQLDSEPRVVRVDTQQPIGFKCQCQVCSIDTYFAKGCHSKSYPHLDTSNLTDVERKELYYGETESIQSEFSTFIKDLIKLFEDQKINPRDLVTTVPSNAPCGFCVCTHHPTSSLTGARSINEVFQILLVSKYLSFVNYGIAELLIKQHGMDRKDDSTTSETASPVNKINTKLLQTYTQKFRQFCKRSVFELPQNILPTPYEGERLAFKVIDGFIKSFHSNTCVTSANDAGVSSSSKESSKTLRLSLEDTIVVQGRIAECLGLSLKNKWTLIFLGASRGCIELNFSVPAAFFGKLKSQLSTRRATSHFSSDNELVKLDASGVHLLCGPPGIPNATVMTSDSITLRWTEPEYCGFHMVKYYRVYYRSRTDPHDEWKSIDTDVRPFLTIKNLSQKKAYTFKVKAVTDIGAGLESKQSDLIEPQAVSSVEVSKIFRFNSQALCFSCETLKSWEWAGDKASSLL